MGREACAAAFLATSGQQPPASCSVRPDPADPDQKPLNLKRVVDPTGNAKKRRECYVGNLPQHKAPALYYFE